MVRAVWIPKCQISPLVIYRQNRHDLQEQRYSDRGHDLQEQRYSDRGQGLILRCMCILKARLSACFDMLQHLFYKKVLSL